MTILNTFKHNKGVNSSDLLLNAKEDNSMIRMSSQVWSVAYHYVIIQKSV